MSTSDPKPKQSKTKQLAQSIKNKDLFEHQAHLPMLKKEGR
jgi:hypothetical protein